MNCLLGKRVAVSAMFSALLVSTACSNANDKGGSVLDGGDQAGGDGDAGDGDGHLTSDAGGDGDGDNSPGDDGGDSCGASPFMAEPVLRHALFVVDKSGSMKTDANDKWTPMTGALEAALTDVQDALDFGLDLYPADAGDGGDAYCDVPSGTDISLSLGMGAAHVEDMVNLLQGTTPSGGTPTAQALERAHAYFTTGAGKALMGDKVVILATDGGPNCNTALSCAADACTYNLEGLCGDVFDNCCDPGETGVADANKYCLNDAATLSAVQKLASAHIPTAVVGIPGSEAFADQLDALARAGGITSGGAHDYFAVSADGSGGGSLSDVLKRITRNLIKTCELQLASMPPDLDRLNVEVDGTTIPRDSADGWRLDKTTNPPTVVLQGETCQSVESQGATAVNVTYGCPTLILL